MQALKSICFRFATISFTLCAATNFFITPSATAQTVSTVAGTGIASSTGDGAAATLATLNLPHTVLVRRDGSVLIAEPIGHRVRKINAAGIITTFAGNGISGFTVVQRRSGHCG